MKKNQNKSKELSPASVAGLTGMQSVRATFRLSRQTIKTINVVASQLGIRQKSLFDHLMEDVENLAAVADEIQPSAEQEEERVHKTFVVSKKTLILLEQISRTSRASRDVLIECSVRRLQPVIEKEQEKQEKRKEIAGAFRNLVRKGRELLETAGENLDADDPVFEKLLAAVRYSENAHDQIAAYLKKGEDLARL